MNSSHNLEACTSARSCQGVRYRHRQSKKIEDDCGVGVIVAFPGHTHLLLNLNLDLDINLMKIQNCLC